MKLKLALLAGAAARRRAVRRAAAVQIIPSVLPADFAALGLDCTALEKAGCDRIQFDVMDGNFVPNLTFGPDVIAAQRKTTKLMFETQLMVSERCTERCCRSSRRRPRAERRARCGHRPRRGVHAHPPQLIEHPGHGRLAVRRAEPVDARRGRREHLGPRRPRAGHDGEPRLRRPGLHPDDDRQDREDPQVDRRPNLDADIEVDGGIKATPETIGACAAAGANCFIAGSGLRLDGMSRASRSSRPSPRSTRRVIGG